MSFSFSNKEKKENQTSTGVVVTVVGTVVMTLACTILDGIGTSVLTVHISPLKDNVVPLKYRNTKKNVSTQQISLQR